MLRRCGVLGAKSIWTLIAFGLEVVDVPLQVNEKRQGECLYIDIWVRVLRDIALLQVLIY